MRKTCVIIPLVKYMNRKNIEKIAQTPEDKFLLAKVWDKIYTGLEKNIPVNTGFLSSREQELTHYLFGSVPGLHLFGGYNDAERQVLVYLPDYLDEDTLWLEDSPVVCLRASYFQDTPLSHRDFLGGLMGVGIHRDCVGDICVGNGSCDFFVTKEITPYLLQNFESAGRTKLRLKQVPLSHVHVPVPETRQVKDTLASLRLDSVISSGFSIGRSQAAQYVTSGRVAIDGLPCEKPDKAVTQGMKISVRGLGKLKLSTVGGQSKKGRIFVVIDVYV